MTATVSAPPAPASGSGQTAAVSFTAINLAAVAALFVPGVLAFGPVFGGLEGHLAAGGGVALGMALAWASWRYRWPVATTTAATVAGYLAFGGALALPRTTLFGFVPTLDTLVRLVPLSVQAWRDLLTVSLPASNFTGPAVVPYLSGLLLGLVGTRLGVRSRRFLWALLPPLVLLVLGILWGLDVAPWGALLGLGYVVVALAWTAWRRIESGRVDGEQILVSAGGQGLARRRLRGALGMIAGGAALSLLVSPLLATGERYVLRQNVQPPLQLQDYASPLTSFRFLELDQSKVPLFTVSGLPEGARVRLAALDSYDGRVFSVSDASSSFVRIGAQTLGGDGGTTSPVQVDVAAFPGVWMPGGGDVRGVAFAGPNADAQSETLYYNPFGGTLVTTASLREGDSYTVNLVDHPQPELTSSAVVSDQDPPELTGVPEIVGQTASDFAGEASTTVEQLRAIEKRLQQGYYSDGADGLSAAGHSAARISSMLSAQQLVGDDEQYAVAMALMARQLGIPCRVVMGFYPETPQRGRFEVTGELAHVWVEVPFQGLGWVQFDPTPDRDRRPQATEPKPKPTPRPQVLPPPDPPNDKVDVPLDDPGKKKKAEEEDNGILLRILLGVAAALGIGAVLSAPFVIIGALKQRRRQRRVHDPVLANRISGAWDELTDVATDLGARLSPIATRREIAAHLEQAYPDAQPSRIAARVDAQVFGAAEPSAEAATQVWTSVAAAVGTMRAGVGRWRRFVGFCSLRSFRAARGSARTPGLARRLRRKESR